MSDEIKITVVMDDEKQNTESGEQKSRRILLTQEPFVTLMSVLQKNRLLSGNLCGGRGECGGCAVQFLEGATMPTPLERKRFSPEELRRGYRLACLAKPRTDCVVRLSGNKEPEVPILTKTIPLSGETAISEIGAGVMESEEGRRKNASMAIDKSADDSDYMIAVDLGTTTIVMQLYSMAEGAVVDTYCEHNPQRSYGSDVLSRIQVSCEGHREELQRLVCESLLRGLRRFVSYLNRSSRRHRITAVQEGLPAVAEKQKLPADAQPEAGTARLRCMCIAGNTAMEHLLMGYDVQSLGRSPFTPVEIGVQEAALSDLFACLDTDASAAGGFLMQAGSLKAEAGLASEPDTLGSLSVYLAPGISAFVGGDIVAGLYAMRMLPGFEDAGGVRFLIDLGTNGEMAITDGKRMLVTATAAGPAFEGGGENALIGTDRIALAASLLREGILDETGLLAEPYFLDGVPVRRERSRIVVERVQDDSAAAFGRGVSGRLKKEDIRALQMAKAAIRAGIEILWQEMGRPRVDMVYLAGGFGYELDVEAAFAIGLLPVRLRGRVQAVGNTSLAGAFLMGRAFWKGGIDREALEEALSSETLVESVNLAKRKNFAALYLQYMNLEEN